MAEQHTPVLGNPGYAGETGEFQQLTEADIRGSAFVGHRPVAGGEPGAACSYPFQIVEKQPGAPLFEGPYRTRLEKIISRYPTPQGALLPVLSLAQEIRGHLSADSMAQVAAVLGLSPTYVRGVATFYTMYNKAPVGDYLIQVCTNVACNLCGADDVMERFLAGTGTETGEISADGQFTVIEAECLGACGFPTAVQINERYFENVTPADVDAILERLRTERRALRERPAVAPATHESAPRPAGRVEVPNDPGAQGTGRVEVPDDPGAQGTVVQPEATPYVGQDRTPPAAARPPATDRPASRGQG